MRPRLVRPSLQTLPEGLADSQQQHPQRSSGAAPSLPERLERARSEVMLLDHLTAARSQSSDTVAQPSESPFVLLGFVRPFLQPFGSPTVPVRAPSDGLRLGRIPSPCFWQCRSARGGSIRRPESDRGGERRAERPPEPGRRRRQRREACGAAAIGPPRDARARAPRTLLGNRPRPVESASNRRSRKGRRRGSRVVGCRRGTIVTSRFAGSRENRSGSCSRPVASGIRDSRSHSRRVSD